MFTNVRTHLIGQDMIALKCSPALALPVMYRRFATMSFQAFRTGCSRLRSPVARASSQRPTRFDSISYALPLAVLFTPLPARNDAAMAGPPGSSHDFTM